MKLVECVPNFSEGRRKDVIDTIVVEARSRNVKVLDVESDPDHNRSVLTFVGTPEAVKEAGLAVSRKAIELIDLNKHQGQHPRMGAIDVVPFVPISDITTEECVQLARDFAKEFASRFNVPVFLYEEAATRPDRRNLADIRKGEFEGLREEIGKNPDKTPDFGPNAIHPTAGATAIGARQILIAYNINLGTTDVGVAKRIAKEIRGRDGGLSHVKALGFELKDRGIVQVSMNMVDYKKSQLFKAFELVRSFAEHYDVPIVSSEIVGLVPMTPLIDTAEFYLRLQGFNENQVLEKRLFETQSDRLIAMDLATFGFEVASDKPVPGGGSVSAYVGSLAASLVSMVSRLTGKRVENEKQRNELASMLEKSESLQRQLLDLVDEDSKSFASVMEAYRLPKDTETQKRARSQEIQSRLKKAADVPLNTAEAAAGILSLARSLAELANANVMSDLQTALFLAHSSTLGGLANVRINLASIEESDFRKHAMSKVEIIERQVEIDRAQALEAIAARRKAS